jgi:hypothetical protein
MLPSYGGCLNLGTLFANVDDTERGLMTSIGGTVAVMGLVLLIWAGTGVVISWFIAFGALLFATLLIFLALRLNRLQQRIDSYAPLRRTK